MPRTIDIIILLACIITIAIAFYDISKLNDIQDKAINKCNEHWVKEFNSKCAMKEALYPEWNLNYSLGYMAKLYNETKS